MTKSHLSIDYHASIKESLNYRDNDAWIRGVELAQICFQFMDSKREDTYSALGREIIQSALKLTSVIAIANRHDSHSKKLDLFNIARSSIARLDSHIAIAGKLDYIDFETRRKIEVILIEIDRLVEKSINRLID